MKYNRTYNFSAGPAMMPEPVLEEIRDEMMNYRGSGMCVMEMSHRSKVFQQIRAAVRDCGKIRRLRVRHSCFFLARFGRGLLAAQLDRAAGIEPGGHQRVPVGQRRTQILRIFHKCIIPLPRSFDPSADLVLGGSGPAYDIVCHGRFLL